MSKRGDNPPATIFRTTAAIEAASAVAKLLGEQESAADHGDAIVATGSNRIRVIDRGGVARLGDQRLLGDGFFTEHRIDELQELAGIAGKSWQTVVSFGVSARDGARLSASKATATAVPNTAENRNSYCWL